MLFYKANTIQCCKNLYRGLDKLKCTFKPRRKKHFNCGEKLANFLLCRMRIGRSYLKSHGFAINLSSSDRCMCGAVDDNKHLLLFCFIFQEERQTMLSKINSILPNFLSLTISKQVFILLNGINLDSLLPDPRNRLIMLTVQKFITQTNRFSKHYEWIISPFFLFLSFFFLVMSYFPFSSFSFSMLST